MVAGSLDDLLHAVRVADIAWIDAQAGGAGLRGLDAAAVVEMDVGDEGDGALGDDLLERPGRGLVGDGDADDVGAGLRAGLDLGDGRGHVGRQRVGHRLDGDRRVATDGHGADMDPPRRAAVDLPPGADGMERHGARPRIGASGSELVRGAEARNRPAAPWATGHSTGGAAGSGA